MGYFLWNGLRIIDQKYLTGLLEPRVMPCAGFVGDGFMLMHDNARSATRSDLCKAIFAGNSNSRYEATSL